MLSSFHIHFGTFVTWLRENYDYRNCHHGRWFAYKIRKDTILLTNQGPSKGQSHYSDLYYTQKRDNVITPTLNTPTVITPTLITPTIITPTLNTSTVTDSLCNSGGFSNSNAVRDCPFNLKRAWFLSRSRKFFSYAVLLFLKLFSAAQQNIFYKRKYYFM
jgi:hypothetical protein